MINIDELIAQTAKEKNPDLGILRLVKAEILKWMKDNPGKDFDEAQQAKILKKMYHQRIETVKVYEAANRLDLAENEQKEADFILKFIPTEPTEEEIINYTKYIIESVYGSKVTMKQTKEIIAEVNKKYPGVSGKVIVDTVKSYL